VSHAATVLLEAPTRRVKVSIVIFTSRQNSRIAYSLPSRQKKNWSKNVFECLSPPASPAGQLRPDTQPQTTAVFFTRSLLCSATKRLPSTSAGALTSFPPSHLRKPTFVPLSPHSVSAKLERWSSRMTKSLASRRMSGSRSLRSFGTAWTTTRCN